MARGGVRGATRGRRARRIHARGRRPRLYEIGMVSLRRGDLPAAEDALTRAHGSSDSPNPRSRWCASHRAGATALASIRHAIEEPPTRVLMGGVRRQRDRRARRCCRRRSDRARAGEWRSPGAAEDLSSLVERFPASRRVGNRGDGQRRGPVAEGDAPAASGRFARRSSSGRGGRAVRGEPRPETLGRVMPLMARGSRAARTPAARVDFERLGAAPTPVARRFARAASDGAPSARHPTRPGSSAHADVRLHRHRRLDPFAELSGMRLAATCSAGTTRRCGRSRRARRRGDQDHGRRLLPGLRRRRISAIEAASRSSAGSPISGRRRVRAPVRHRNPSCRGRSGLDYVALGVNQAARQSVPRRPAERSSRQPRRSQACAPASSSRAGGQVR